VFVAKQANKQKVAQDCEGKSDTMDWVLAESTFTYKFPSKKSFVVSLFDDQRKAPGVCCRVNNHADRAKLCKTRTPSTNELGDSQHFNVVAIIDLGNAVKWSPALVSTPIISAPRHYDMKVDFAPSFYPKGLSYEFTPKATSGLYKTNPSGLSISRGGTMSWKPGGSTELGLYAVQVR
jgi:hypothetical protein